MKILTAWLERFRAYTERIGYTCDSCGAELFDYPNTRVCSRCDGELLRNDGLVCEKCGRKTVSNGVCVACKRHAPRFTRGFSPFVYKERVAVLINNLKNGKRRLAHFFGSHMAEYIAQGLREEALYYTGEETILVVPVPTTEEGRAERGYNQTELLSSVLCKRLEDLGIKTEMRPTVLRKSKETAQQKNLGVAARMQNVAGAYRVAERVVCRDRIILLVDDIMTTGATGSECAKKLRSAGAKAVYFLTACAVEELLK